ncbi:hypothetical protein EV44_g3897 [Erysiphe necator]|uniref:Uncharacterized protein n=1 Tax=Uncinula necator TaxID=52586 RepID=A0A0B1P034_UNCNE|nr:hypothetical protein EV44_g3897 [Erysiphe necator]
MKTEIAVINRITGWKTGREQPAKSKSSPSRGAGVNAQYALHIWDSQEDSHSPSLQDSHSSPQVSIVFVSTSLSPPHLFSRIPTIVPGSIECRALYFHKEPPMKVSCWRRWSGAG